MSQKFKKKPVVIDAVQWTNEPGSLEAIHAMGCEPVFAADGSAALVIHTLEGDHRADVGDWIIRGVKGEYYPCKPDIFAATYEQPEEETRIVCNVPGHSYTVIIGGLTYVLEFQRGAVREVGGRNGLQNEEVLTILIDRMKHLQGEFPCRENAIVITKLEEALLWLNRRTELRRTQGVEGRQLGHADARLPR